MRGGVSPIDGRFNLFSDKAKCRGVSAWVFVHLRTGRWSNYVIPWVFLAVSACGIPAETCDSSWISRRQGPKGHTCKANLVMSAWGGCATKQFQGIPRDCSGVCVIFGLFLFQILGWLITKQTSIILHHRISRSCSAAVSPQTSTAPRSPILHDGGVHPDSGDLVPTRESTTIHNHNPCHA